MHKYAYPMSHIIPDPGVYCKSWEAAGPTLDHLKLQMRRMVYQTAFKRKVPIQHRNPASHGFTQS